MSVREIYKARLVIVTKTDLLNVSDHRLDLVANSATRLLLARVSFEFFYSILKMSFLEFEVLGFQWGKDVLDVNRFEREEGMLQNLAESSVPRRIPGIKCYLSLPRLDLLLKFL